MLRSAKAAIVSEGLVQDVFRRCLVQQQQAQAQGFVTLALAEFEQGQETKSHLLNQIPTKPNNIQ
ncbi:MAG: hypothetical protein HC862_31355 [Scytonema sp. RU_4_4]|nr:hypothetical protein [Scytonema sp. RU_4_4]NJR75025.1 hypothetical protein [Scytonema sp. CRU_2_7]